MKLTEEQKAANKAERHAARKAAKEAARVEQEKNQKPVKSLKITIEWRKSRNWGSNPHAEAVIFYHDGTSERRGGYTASGWGYDKESTVISEIFNDFLKYKLWAMSEKQIKGGHGTGDTGPAPYGINNHNGRRSYGYGIGANCYYAISEYIGGKFANVASGKTFDVYEYIDN